MAADQLSGLDTAFLCLDRASTPMNLGALAVFAPPRPVHPARLVALLRERAARIPRLRQRVRGPVLPMSSPRWAEDPDFDVTDHVFAHHLHRPHDADQLSNLVADIMAARLAPSRPLWQLHVITGLPGGRFAVLPKLHHALADGAGVVLLGLALMDDFAGTPIPSPRQPEGGGGLRALAGSAQQSMDIAGAVLRSARPNPPTSPLLAPSSTDRTLATLRLDLHDIKQVRRRHGGTANDVLLAVLAGALRDWLLGRGDRADGLALRALIPVNQRGRGRSGPNRGAGNQLSGYLCDLPVGEADPVRRLRAVRAMMDANKEAGPTRGAGALPMLADLVPAALHRVATPMLGQCAPLLCDTVVTNVPLPNLPLRCDGADLREVYPIVPLAPGHALGVAFCTYRGTVHVGLHANARALPDLAKLQECFTGSLSYLHQLCA